MLVKTTDLNGSDTPLDSFAVAVSVTVSLMFVTVLLAAGMLALEREEHAFGRLVRGLVTRLELLAEKVVLAAACAFVLAAVMVAGLSAFVSIAWSQAPLWLAALLFGALAFSALGVAIGGAGPRGPRGVAARLPALAADRVPRARAERDGLGDALRRHPRSISAAFPFKPTLEALDRTLNDSDESIAGPLAHLAALTLAYVARRPAGDAALRLSPLPTLPPMIGRRWTGRGRRAARAARRGERGHHDHGDARSTATTRRSTRSTAARR